MKWTRHEFHGDDEPREGPLLHLVYDIPYFGACGVFPPLHILNQTFERGGSTGGMSPGATWKPFTLAIEEFLSLVEEVRATPVSAVYAYARYAHFEFVFDPRFDHIQDRFVWLQTVCAEHRDDYHRRIASQSQSNA